MSQQSETDLSRYWEDNDGNNVIIPRRYLLEIILKSRKLRVPFIGELSADTLKYIASLAFKKKVLDSRLLLLESLNGKLPEIFTAMGKSSIDFCMDGETLNIETRNYQCMVQVALAPSEAIPDRVVVRIVGDAIPGFLTREVVTTGSVSKIKTTYQSERMQFSVNNSGRFTPTHGAQMKTSYCFRYLSFCKEINHLCDIIKTVVLDTHDMPANVNDLGERMATPYNFYRV